MKRLLIAMVAVVSGSLLIATASEAARLGGGRTSGIQRSVTPPPAQPRQAPAAQPQQQTPAQQAAPASGLSRWMPMLGGLAIGGLLGSMFGGGLGGALGGILMMALLAIAVVFAVRFFMRSKQSTPPMRLSGFGNETARMPVTNDLANSRVSETQLGSSGPAAVPGVAVPAGFDLEGFLRAAKRNFMKLQVANDAGDVAEIREMATPEMFAELNKDIAARGGRSQTTDVVTVDADLVELVTEGNMHHAGVRFSGYVREEPGTPPQPFAEVWHLTKPEDGSTGWLLAGIQQQSLQS